MKNPPSYDVMMKPTAEDAEPAVYRINSVWKDQLDGEREGAMLALNQPGLDSHKATLTWWAAMVRLGHYKGGFYQFIEDLIHVEGVKAAEEPELDPTRQTVSTGSVSPSPLTSVPPSAGS